MFDETIYDSCPFCNSKKISESNNAEGTVKTIKCDNEEECGAVIETRPIKKEEDNG